MVVGRQLFAGDCDGEGDLRVTRAACGPWWGASWQVIRGTGGAEVATPSGSSTGQAASGPRSGDRAQRSVELLRTCLAFGRGRAERVRCTVSGRTPRHDASRRRAESRTARFLTLVSTQRWRRVAFGGNVDDSSRWVERLCGADRVACPWALRFGAGSSELEPTSPFARAGTLCRCGVSRASEGRGWRQTVATGGCQSAVRVTCDPSRINCNAESLRGASPAPGRRRSWCAEAASRKRDSELVSDPCGRQG